MVDFENLDPKEYILIKGAKVHNLKNIDLAIPKNKLVVITGLSGSGKSSLAFNTLYTEGQRRYVESLSSYARQFLEKLEKPDVEYIKGIAPAISIKQKVISTNQRSTVGTTTEIYDYLKLLYARVGRTFSPISGKEVKKDSVTDVIDFLKDQKIDSHWTLLSPIQAKKDIVFSQQLKLLFDQGFTRVEINQAIQKIEDLISFNFEPTEGTSVYLVIDRVQLKTDEDFYHRLADSIQIAFYEGNGTCYLKDVSTDKLSSFSNLFELDGQLFNEPNVHFFSFNNPFGACPTCEGFGKKVGIDPTLVVPNQNLSLYEDAIICWRGEKMSKWKDKFIALSEEFDFPIHKAYVDLSDQNKKDLWIGNKKFKGLNGFFKMLEEKSYKIQFRVMLSKYRGRTICPSCQGKRLRSETNYVKIHNTALSELVDLPIDELALFFKKLKLNDYDKKIAKRLLLEITNRLSFLLDVGLNYLTLNRASNSLSGGESQRINLSTSLGSSLVGSIYILDEPSIGLHSKDTERLIVVLKKLRDLGNTVIVVEHDEDVINAADYLIDIGPKAGRHGGEVVFAGEIKDLLKNKKSLTALYLTGEKKIEVPQKRRKFDQYIQLTGVNHNNLNNLNVKLPTQTLTAITGVSGSGKSTLLKDVLSPYLEREFGLYKNKPGLFKEITYPDSIEAIELIDQNPMGKSSRSNPVTYVKAYDDIRSLYTKLKASKIHQLKNRHFSFNVEGGRCEKCKGDGKIIIEMQFMADVELTCDECKGKRFKEAILLIKYQGKNIADILDLTVNQAIEFFNENKQIKIIHKLQPLQDVGLGYLKLGQSSSTLSGGEAQRVKLATFLSKGNNKAKTLFIFDEPSTGLHFHDIKKLLDAFNALIDKGHTVFVIEHNMDIIKCADWVIDLGPEGGKKGGKVVGEGTPETIAKTKGSHTAFFLKEKV